MLKSIQAADAREAEAESRLDGVSASFKSRGDQGLLIIRSGQRKRILRRCLLATEAISSWTNKDHRVL